VDCLLSCRHSHRRVDHHRIRKVFCLSLTDGIVEFVALPFDLLPLSLTLASYVFAEYAASLPAHTLSNPPNRTIPTYLALFIFAFVFDILLSWDAIRLQNTIQVIGLNLFQGAMLIYSAIQIEQIHDAITATKLTPTYLNFDPWPSNSRQLWMNCLLLSRGTPIPHCSALCDRYRSNRTPFYHHEIAPRIWLEHLQAHRRFSSNATTFSNLSDFRCSSQVRLLFLSWL